MGTLILFSALLALGETVFAVIDKIADMRESRYLKKTLKGRIPEGF